MDVSCTFNQSVECVTTGVFHAVERDSLCKMLNWLGLESRFLEDESGLVVVEIPCHSKGPGKPLSLVLLMPKAGEMGILKNGIAEARLFELLTKLESGTIELAMPAVNGCADGFMSDGADSALIRSLVQRVQIHVCEAGTQASAASGIACGLACISPPKPRFVFDRPFVMLWVDRQKPALLLAGVVESECLLRRA